MLNKLLPAGLITCIFFSCGSDSSPMDCGHYKKGSFHSHLTSEHINYSFKFVRDDSIQVETEENSGDRTVLRIVWTSPCSYELYLVSTTKSMPDSFIRIAQSHPVKTTIVSGTNDYYLFESAYEGSMHVLKDTMWLNRPFPEKLPAERPAH